MFIRECVQNSFDTNILTYSETSSFKLEVSLYVSIEPSHKALLCFYFIIYKCLRLILHKTCGLLLAI